MAAWFQCDQGVGYPQVLLYLPQQVAASLLQSAASRRLLEERLHQPQRGRGRRAPLRQLHGQQYLLLQHIHV